MSFENSEVVRADSVREWNRFDEGRVPFWKRFIHFCLDHIIFGIFSMLVLRVVALYRIFSIFEIPMNPRFVLILCSVALYIISESCCYYFFELFFQKTPSKFLTRTKVVNKDGRKPSRKQVLLRTFSRFMPLEPVSFNFDVSWWHDRWSQTMVVDDNYPEFGEPRNCELNYKHQIFALLAPFIHYVVKVFIVMLKIK